MTSARANEPPISSAVFPRARILPGGQRGPAIVGVDESTCMSVTGHETNAMFRRYTGIIDPSE